MNMSKYFFRIAVIAITAVFFMTTATQESFAQLNKKQTKQLEKERAKMKDKKLKEYKTEGWKLGASSRTIEVALLEHYAKLAEDENNQELVGEVSQCKSINVCKQFATTNALNQYASLASGNIKGRVESMLRADANMPQVEMDKLIAAYEREVKAEVGGVLTESYSVVRDDPKSKTKEKEYKVFFIVNEEKAGAARQRAMERSLKETQVAVKEAEEISKFVKEGFNIE
jgi:hypothetical protein